MLRVLVAFGVGLLASRAGALGPNDLGAWRVDADFELGPVGAYAYPDGGGSDGFDERPADGSFGWADTRYSDAERFAGRQSAAISVEAGQDNLGGRIYFPRPLRKGDEVWIRLHVKLQAEPGFDLAADPMLKFLRLKPRLPDQSDSYDNDILFNNPNGRHSPFVFSVSHPGGGNVEGGVGGVDDPVPGSWETYELYQSLDDAEGARSRTRFWKDGRLLIDSDTPVLKTAVHEIAFLELVGYWNGGAPRPQTFWVDGIRIQNHIPTRTDAEGHPFLGAGPGADDPASSCEACGRAPGPVVGAGGAAAPAAVADPLPAARPPAPRTACSDGVDNDGDGRIDHPADRGCRSHADDNEHRGRVRSGRRACNDGIDNDGDGYVDFPDDPGCRRPRDRRE